MTFPTTTLRALLGQAIGDAFGAPFEFHPDAPRLAELSLNEGRYLTHVEVAAEPHRSRVPGQYTDDTQQALLLLWIHHHLERRGKDPVSGALAADIFIKACRKMSETKDGLFGVHRGTGKNFRETVTTGNVLDSAGIGAAMKIGPVATLFTTKEDVACYADTIARATTCNPFGIAGAVVFALACWRASHPAEIVAFDTFAYPGMSSGVMDAWGHFHGLLLWPGLEMEGRLAAVKEAGFESTTLGDGLAITGVPWVLHCVSQRLPFAETMALVTSVGGDTDTLCAMAGCLLGIRGETIPPWMLAGLRGIENIEHHEDWHPVEGERDLTQEESGLRIHRIQEASALQVTRAKGLKADAARRPRRHG